MCWEVADDMPYDKVPTEVDGEDGYMSISKTVNIILFDSKDVFDVKDGSNRVLTFYFIKTRGLF